MDDKLEQIKRDKTIYIFLEIYEEIDDDDESSRREVISQCPIHGRWLLREYFDNNKSSLLLSNWQVWRLEYYGQDRKMKACQMGNDEIVRMLLEEH